MVVGPEELRRRADNLVWAGDADWKYEPDADPASAYAEFVGMTTPTLMLLLLDVVEAARPIIDYAKAHEPANRQDFERLEAALAALDSQP
jgi:hypothetical protein